MKPVALVVLLLASSASAQIPGFTSTPVNFPGNASSEALDPSGNIWIADPTNGGIGRLELPSNTYTAFPAPAAEKNARPYNIAVTPDGAVWYTDYNNPVVGRRSIDGNFTLFPVAAPAFFIAEAPGDGVFFSFFGGAIAAVGYLSADGRLTNIQLPTPAGAFPGSMTKGPDGAAYFTDLISGHRLVRVGLDGGVKTFPVAAANPPNGFNWAPSITTGPDGNIWFTHATAIGRLRLSDGLVTEYPIPYAMADASGICAGGDGNIWYADSLAGAGVIGQLVVSTATDDGHATINKSPGIGEPIGIIPIWPAPAPASAAKTRSGTGGPSAFSTLRFYSEKNATDEGNIYALEVANAASTSADLDIKVSTPKLTGLTQTSTASFTVTISNLGPTAASPPVLEFKNVIGLRNLLTPGFPGWTCSSAIDAASCTRGSDMPADTTEVAVFNAEVETGGQNPYFVSWDVSIHSSTSDPNLANNDWFPEAEIENDRDLLHLILFKAPTQPITGVEGRQ